MDDMHDRIRQRAYRLWVEEGCPEGRQDIHWERARELVAIEQNQKHTTKPVTHHQGAGGEPVEPMEAIENAGEFPTQTDQGEEQGTPQRRRAAAAAPSKRKTAEPKAALKSAAKPAAKPAKKAAAKPT